MLLSAIIFRGRIIMRPAVSYKPSNTFSFVGFILMFLSMLITGALLSWLYVVLQAVIPIIYLCVLITVGFGAAVGGIGYFFVKTYKIRHPMIAVLATLIAMLFVYYFHWCVYVARDYDKNIYDSMKTSPAASYYLGLTDSEMDQNGLFDDPSRVVSAYKSLKVKSFTKLTTSELDSLPAKQRDLYNKNATVWEFMDLDNILGTNDSEIKESVQNLRGKNAYTFTYEYRKQPKHNIGFLLVHPGELWDDIRSINTQGRWTMSSRHSYSSKSSKTPVTGVFLWLTWIGEMLLMFIPAVAIVRARATSPFIENDNDWAVTDKPQLSFKFVDPFPGNSNGENQFKVTFKNDIDSLFTLQPLLPQMGSLNTYYTVSYCHSRNYDENYLTIMHTRINNAKNNQRVNSAIVKNVRVDADYIATLHGMFGYPQPLACNGVNRFAQQAQPQQEQANEQPQQQQQYAQQQAYEQPQQQQQYPQQQAYEQPQQQQQYTQQQAYAQPQQQQQYPQQQAYEQQPQQQQQAPAQNLGEMDAIDTSNIDLSSLDSRNR